MKTIVRSKNTTAWAEISFSPKGTSAIVRLYNSNRMKNPKQVWTTAPDVTIDRHFSEHAQRALAKKQRNEAKRELVVGDVLVSKYRDRPHFYRVKELVGKASVRLEQLHTLPVSEKDHFGNYHMMPDLVSNPIKTDIGNKARRVVNGTEVKIDDYTGFAMKWDGESRFYRELWD